MTNENRTKTLNEIIEHGAATPILDDLIRRGTVYAEGFDFVGVAHDGVKVRLGSLFSKVWTERYLRDHPTPKDW